MKKVKLSVIIPVYNMEMYIEQCLLSTLNQDIPKDEYEIIVVDDCSTDNSIKIVERYQKINSNIKIIRHSKNKRQGGARNTGVKAALGEYILFLDADDYFAENMYKQLLSTALNNNLEIVNFDYYYQEDDGTFSRGNSGAHCSLDIMSGASYLKKNGLIYKNIWTRLYKRSLLVDNDIWFTEHVTFEDVDFAVKALYCAKRCMFVPINALYYRYNFESTARQKIKGDRLADQVKLANRLLHFLNNIQSIDNEIYRIFSRMAIKIAKISITRSVFLDTNERNIFYDSLEQDHDKCEMLTNSLPNTYKFYMRHRIVVNFIFSPLCSFLRLVLEIRRKII